MSAFMPIQPLLALDAADKAAINIGVLPTAPPAGRVVKTDNGTFCDLCFTEEPLTERKAEHLCGDCYRWSDYWDSLSSKERDDIYLEAS